MSAFKVSLTIHANPEGYQGGHADGTPMLTYREEPDVAASEATEPVVAMALSSAMEPPAPHPESPEPDEGAMYLVVANAKAGEQLGCYRARSSSIPAAPGWWWCTETGAPLVALPEGSRWFMTYVDC